MMTGDEFTPLIIMAVIGICVVAIISYVWNWIKSKFK